jgi:hypothetical protein
VSIFSIEALLSRWFLYARLLLFDPGDGSYIPEDRALDNHSFENLKP